MGAYHVLCEKQAILAHVAVLENPHFVKPGASMLFENRYFDASFALGIWYVCIFQPISPIFTPFHPLLLISTTSTPFHVDFSPLWDSEKARGDLAILIDVAIPTKLRPPRRHELGGHF